MAWAMYQHMEGWVMAQYYHACGNTFEDCQIDEVIKAKQYGGLAMSHKQKASLAADVLLGVSF